MELPVSLRRLGYRSAYWALRVYWFLLRPSSRGVKCVLTHGEDVLLVRHTYGPRAWELPGGGTRGDEEPVATARREMNEELGITIDDWTRRGETVVDLGHHRDRVQFFTAELPAPEIKLNRAELSEARWFPRGQLPPDLGRYARAIIASLPEA
ncbi:MAG TPA: NUDIX domain-containing protein [Solirubrobacteraceae bacterium]|nr:NUDIX domain-containing protein [Solirubrobacteraceae bacterium]